MLVHWHGRMISLSYHCASHFEVPEAVAAGELEGFIRAARRIENRQDSLSRLAEDDGMKSGP